MGLIFGKDTAGPRLAMFSARGAAAGDWLRRRLAVPVGPPAPGATTAGAATPGRPADGARGGRARLAVLIDADNAQAALIEPILAEIAKYGIAHVKRAYGDWTGSSLKSWKEQLLDQSIQPIQQFAYVTGKNATDAAMVIDAMDLLYRSRFDGFCIVSSDSDFTRLAARLRESGRTVYGFGERKTPRSFVRACDKFIYVENLVGPSGTPPPPGAPVTGSPAEPVAVAPPSQPIPGPELRGDTRLVNRLRGAVEAASDDDGWANQASVGHLISSQDSSFDARNYGYQKLGELITAIGLFEVDRRVAGNGKPNLVYVRDKRYLRLHRPTPAGPAVSPAVSPAAGPAAGATDAETGAPAVAPPVTAAAPAEEPEA